MWTSALILYYPGREELHTRSSPFPRLLCAQWTQQHQATQTTLSLAVSEAEFEIPPLPISIRFPFPVRAARKDGDHSLGRA